jgi:hypothetical protein
MQAYKRLDRLEIDTGQVAAGLAGVLAFGIMLSACASAAPSGPGEPLIDAAATTACVPSELGGCLPTAPEAALVDRVAPTFSDPTHVTNPLHPTTGLHSAVMVGRSDGSPFRVEITLLPGTKTIEWDGRIIEALESQYVAFVDGRIQEVALDWYAQADDGSVWYLGEDVFNYEDGLVADTHGTWIAGKDGPGAMIMPGAPRVGDVYRPENIPGLVYEEVTVRSTGVTVAGPTGPVPGAIIVDELHMDGSHEDKTFAPGYGEFSTGAGANLEALALGVPTDSLTGPMPDELPVLFQAAIDIDDLLRSGDAPAAAEAHAALTKGWDAYRAGGTPPLLGSQMAEALEALGTAMSSGDTEASRQAALRTALAGLDFQLRSRPPVEVDWARFGVWLRQFQLDIEAGDSGALSGDAATLEWIRDRVSHAVLAAEASEIDSALEGLRAAVEEEDFQAAATALGLLQDVYSRVAVEG